MPPLTDRAHDWASANGFEVDARFPFLGDTLPASTEGYAGSVIYGGRFNADSEAENPFLRDEYRWIEMSLAADLPMLGICLGAQMIARHLGADVGPLPDGRVEFGFYEIRPMPWRGGFPSRADDGRPSPISTSSEFPPERRGWPKATFSPTRPSDTVPRPSASSSTPRPRRRCSARGRIATRSLRPPRLPVEGGAGRPCRGGAGAAGALVRGAAHWMFRRRQPSGPARQE
jgi:hypothetical protein